MRDVAGPRDNSYKGGAVRRVDGGLSGFVAFLLGAIAFALAVAAQAATIVSGPIISNTAWTADGGPYEVAGDVAVQGGAVLTIEAGTRIVFRPGTNLTIVQGTLRALGRADAPVVLTSVRDTPADTPAPGDWGQLTFTDGTNDGGTLLEHVTVAFGSGVRIERASPTLNALRLERNSGPAIAIDLASSPVGSGLSAEGNQLDGILVPAGETTGDVLWGLVGIPYVVAQGIVSVGAAPRVQFAVPETLEQGATVEVSIAGSRLGGADRITFADPGISGRILPGGTEVSVPVEVEVAADAALGATAFELQTDAGTVVSGTALTVVVPLPPIAAGEIQPTSIRRGETLAFGVTGANLQGAGLSVSNPGLSASNLETTDTTATFTLAAAANAALGPATLTFSNPAVARGTASVQVQVNRALPKLVVSPAILAIPPDGTTRQFRVGLTEADDVDRDFTLSLGNPALASVEPTSFTLPAGQIQQTVSVRGTTLGQTVLNVTSPGLAALAVPLYVTPDFNSINVAYSRQVRVQRDTDAASVPPVTITPLISPAVRLGAGRYVAAVNPATLVVGSVQELVISGGGLEGVTGVSFAPSEGITLSNVSAAPDGNSVRVLVTVASDAAIGVRRVALAGVHQPYLAVGDAATRVLITPPPPQVASIAPLVVARGTTGLAFVVRGRNLQNVRSLTFSPSDGISIGTPSASADGTSVTVGLNVAADAPLGPRLVVATTPAGSSAVLPDATNTLQVVAALGPAVTPLSSRDIRVLKPTPPGQVTQPVASHSNLVKIGVGAYVTRITPAAGTIGETLTLTIAGNALHPVTAVAIEPSTGLTIGSPAIDAGGTSLQVTVGIAADAPQTLRRVRVLAGTQEVAFVDAGRALFRVTAPQPAVVGIDPIAIQVGAAPVTLLIAGQNFQNAETVRLVPPDGVTVGLPPSVNTGGTEIRVTIAATAGAPPGPRAVVVGTPAGETTSAPSPANTLRVVEQLGPAVTPLASNPVRLLKQLPPVTEPNFPIGPVISPSVRVLAEQAPPQPTQRTLGLYSPTARVARGPVATAIAPRAVLTGTSATLTITGVGLDTVSAVAFSPATDITIIGVPVVAADGTSLTLEVSVASSAALGARTVTLATAGGRIDFVDPAASGVVIATPPAIDSITPITARRGEVVNLLIRGSHLTSGARVTVEPPEGITADVSATANASGELTVRLQVAPDAELGARAVRVTTPGGTTSATASPQNTLTIFP